MSININSDTVSSIDLLDRKSFAKEIAFSLVHAFSNGAESIVFGLNGKWGSGKSTLLRFIKEEIESEYKSIEGEECLILEFNPWMFSGQEELQKKFLKKLANKLDSKTALKSKAKKFAKYTEWLTWLKYVNSGLGEGVKELKNYLEAFAEEGSVSEFKSKVDDLIVKSKLRIYIMIDDVDRLSPNEITEVFQLIKLNANFKNTIYLVAYDKDVVQMALIDQYNENGYKYLDKIIQVDYIVPEILSEKVENIFFEELTIFFSHQKINYDTNKLSDIWYYYRFKDYFKTLRDVYRYMNALHFRLPKIYFEINITDFLILEGIRIFDYDNYKKIYTEFSEIIRSSGSLTIINDDDENTNLITKSLVNFLFYKKGHRAAYTYETDKDLCDPKYFEIYFALKMSDSDISENEFEKFIKDKHSRYDLLKIIHSYGRTENFLRRLSNPKLNSHYSINDPSIFNILLTFWDNNESDLGPVAMRLWDALKNIAQSFSDPIEGYKYLIDDLLYSPGHFSFTRLYFLGLMLDNMDENFRYDFYLIKDFVLPYKARVKTALLKILKEWNHYYLPRLSNSKSEFFCRYMVVKFSKEYPSEYKEKLIQILNNQDDLLILLRYVLMIDSGSNKPFRIDFTHKDILFPDNTYEVFIDKLKAIDINYVTEVNKVNLRYFLDFVNKDE